MHKKNVLIISAVTAAFAVTVGFAVQGHTRAAQYELQLENSYTHAYYELSTAVSELDAALEKAQYATTPVMLGVLCTDIYGKAVAAQMVLGELPASSVVLEQTSAFLSRTGDYACAVSKAAAVNGHCSDDTHATLRALAKTASSLATSLLDVQSALVGGIVSVDTLVHAEEMLAQQTDDGDAASGGTSFQTIEADFPETPTLIYDGPFSEHLSNQTPLALKGLPQVSWKKARVVASDFLGMRPEALTLSSRGEGVLPTWGFTAKTSNGEAYIEVTQQGGKVLSLVNSRSVGEATHSVQEAVDIARMFLGTHGFDSMKENYHINQGNILTINFAPKELDVLCYPDLIKVSIALDTGTIVGFESHGWIMNHMQRQFPTPVVDHVSAEAVVSDDLEILSHQLALIPTGGEYEVLCHEFKCRTPESSHVIVYVNAATGNEEKILLLLEGENGTLVW